MKFMLLTILFLLFCSGAAIAGTCNSTSCTGQVTKIYPHGGLGVVYLQSDGDMSQLNCTLDQGLFITLKPTNTLFKEIYSMLLTAQTAKKDVTMRIIENSPDCELIYTQTNL